MIEILELQGSSAAPIRDGHAAEVLENGGLVILPDRPFRVLGEEQDLLDPSVLERGCKNVSLDPSTGRLGGACVSDGRRDVLSGMIARFAGVADTLLAELAPQYAPALQRRRTSFRPGAIADRALSRRKDDRRLHVDAFPANPVQGRRILRVFANIHPEGEPRAWDLGEGGFEDAARRFRSRLSARRRWAGVKARLGVTKGLQSPYDQVMLQLHDAAKLDDAFQETAPKRRVMFPAGSLWVVYTDAVMHAALSGQHALEQTYLLPVEAMRTPAKSPLRTLERLMGRRLA